MDEADRRWVQAELRARDRALQSLRDAYLNELAHLDKLRDEALDKDFYYREHGALTKRVDDGVSEALHRTELLEQTAANDEEMQAIVQRIETRIGALESRLARISGTYVGYAAVGALFIAVVSGFIAHLVGG